MQQVLFTFQKVSIFRVELTAAPRVPFMVHDAATTRNIQNTYGLWYNGILWDNIPIYRQNFKWPVRQVRQKRLGRECVKRGD